MTGRISDPAWREQVVGQLAGRSGRAAAVGAVGAVARWSASAGEVDPEVLAAVRGLRARCRVGLLTNATTRLRGDLARLGLAGEVDEVFGTAELGVAKPDPAVFRLVCGRLGVQPGQCGLVDDTAGHVAAAGAVGLVGHRYVSPAGLVGFLTGKGLWGRGLRCEGPGVGRSPAVWWGLPGRAGDGPGRWPQLWGVGSSSFGHDGFLTGPGRRGVRRRDHRPPRAVPRTRARGGVSAAAAPALRRLVRGRRHRPGG